MSEQETQLPKEPISVYAMMSMMLEQMTELSWSKMGLRPDPITGEMAPDLGEAKAAIDLVSHLATALDGQLDEEDRKKIHSIVRDLKINYVVKSKEAHS